MSANDKLSPEDQALLAELDTGGSPNPATPPTGAPLPTQSQEPQNQPRTEPPRDYENELNSWRGRVESTKADLERERQLAQLHAQRAETLMAEKAANAAAIAERDALITKLKQEQEERNRPQFTLPDKVREQFDPETAKLLEESLKTLVPSGYVRASDVDNLLNERFGKLTAAQAAEKAAQAQQVFRTELRREIPGFTEKATEFFNWATEQKALPSKYLIGVVQNNDLTEIPVLKHHYEQFLKSTTPSGTQALNNASRSNPSSGSAAGQQLTDAQFSEKHEALLAEGKFKEADELFRKWEQALTTS